jgi:hypothetical protein
MKEDDMGGANSTHDGMRNASTILFGKHEGKRPLGRPMRRWKEILEWTLGKWVWRV